MPSLTIIGGRKSGKTQALINELLKDQKGVMVVPTIKERNKLIKYRGVPANKVLVASHLDILRDRPGTNLYIDRADTVLACILKCTVIAMAIDSGEVKVL